MAPEDRVIRRVARRGADDFVRQVPDRACMWAMLSVICLIVKTGAESGRSISPDDINWFDLGSAVTANGYQIIDATANFIQALISGTVISPEWSNRVIGVASGLVWALISLSCTAHGDCKPLIPQPPHIEFKTEKACKTFATEAALQGGVYECDVNYRL